MYRLVTVGIDLREFFKRDGGHQRFLSCGDADEWPQRPRPGETVHFLDARGCREETPRNTCECWLDHGLATHYSFVAPASSPDTKRSLCEEKDNHHRRHGHDGGHREFRTVDGT